MDPNNPIFYTNRATAYHKVYLCCSSLAQWYHAPSVVQMGDFAKALRDSTKSVTKDSSWAKGYYRQGLAIQEMAKQKVEGMTLDGALACFKKACEAKPSDKGFEEAYNLCKKAAMVGKSQAELFKMEGNEFFKIGKQDDAIKCYTK